MNPVRVVPEQRPIEIPKDEIDSTWRVPSRTEPWPRRVDLFVDGSALCSCPRQARGCHHIDEAREERAQNFVDDENWREIRFRAELLREQHEDLLSEARSG